MRCISFRDERPMEMTLTRTRVETWEADEFATNTVLQSLERDLVLLQQPRGIVIGVLHNLVLGRFDDLAGSGRDLVQGREREPDDSGGEKPLSRRAEIDQSQVSLHTEA